MAYQDTSYLLAISPPHVWMRKQGFRITTENTFLRSVCFSHRSIVWLHKTWNIVHVSYAPLLLYVLVLFVLFEDWQDNPWWLHAFTEWERASVNTIKYKIIDQLTIINKITMNKKQEYQLTSYIHVIHMNMFYMHSLFECMMYLHTIFLCYLKEILSKIQ